jgi:ATP-dependent Clp protease ATP-binding subunit ClpC
MSSILAQLIEQAKTGAAEPFERLVEALRADPTLPAGILIELIRAREECLRRAAIAGARGRTEPSLLEALTELAHDDCSTVRECLAATLAENRTWPLDRAVELLLYDEDRDIRQMAVEAARWRPGLEGTLLARLGADSSWQVRQAVAEALATGTPRSVVPALLVRLAEDTDADVQRACAASLEKHLVSLGGYPADLARPPAAALAEARNRVAGFSASHFPHLAAWLEERVARDLDLEHLRGFGTVLTVEAEAGRLPRAFGIDATCAALMQVLTGQAPRAAVLLGEPGSGKTAVIHELAHRLLQHPSGPWHLLRIAPSEFLTGTVYLGEWETKLRKVIDAIRYPRRVVLYVPNLQELSGVGLHSKSDLNVATSLAPYIERGDVTILGESSSEAFRTGLGAVGSLRRLFHPVEMPQATAATTRAIVRAVCDEAGADLPEPVCDRLLELADYYLAGAAQPGRAVGLLRRVLSATAGRRGPIRERDLLATVSTSTGIPVDFLDDAIPLDRTQVRAFFEARIMGQPEAVEAVVDLVTLIKAGLTDPGKPFGVLLFVGPTGVGKTELARALAELLFGDPGRMLRLDMSEFATADAFERLIGWSTRPGLLTAAVREHPFSVLLFDEIEKAHPNIFDLCLQIFDAGRLTDAQGRTADFRRTIIILTSNVGSRIAQEAPVGFGRELPPPPDADATTRELGRWFRPEFLNRLDRIVTFRPLAIETAEKIARREVARVLDRSGIVRRKLAVDVDTAVLPLLLREGYSPAFGARPLKRTVERLVLLPVAQAIAAGTVPAGAVLRLVARGGRLEVEVAPPEPAEGEEPPAPAAQAAPVAQRTVSLVEQAAALRDQASPLASRKSDLMARAARPGFWDDRPTAQAIYDEIYRIDGVLAALDKLDKAARAEAEALERRRPSDRDLARLEERLSALESQARHLAFLVACREPRELGDALVTLTRIASHGADLEAVGRLARMYQGLARRRGFSLEVLDDRRGGEPPEDVIVLQLNGAGAYALLAGEAGLHQVLRGRDDSHHSRRRHPDRDVVRVEVFPAATGQAFGHDEIRVQVRPLGEVQGRLLARPRHEIELRHVPTTVTLRAWTDGSRAEAIERLTPLLRARVEAARAARAEDTGRLRLVRRYTLGPAPLVRDVRTRIKTGRLDQVLRGHLDMFLIPPATPGPRAR